MSDINLRMYAFQHAREIEGQGAPIEKILATAEAICLWLLVNAGPLPTKY